MKFDLSLSAVVFINAVPATLDNPLVNTLGSRVAYVNGHLLISPNVRKITISFVNIIVACLISKSWERPG